MLYFLDTEFLEDGKTIMPISMGIVCDDGRELYFEMEFDEERARAHDFVREHVLPHLRIPSSDRLSREQAQAKIMNFTGEDSNPQFWAYYADYDWVLLCQIFGTMLDLPNHYPKYCMDLQQWWVQLGRPEGLKPQKPQKNHHALEDARWNFAFFRNLIRHQLRPGPWIPNP